MVAMNVTKWLIYFAVNIVTPYYAPTVSTLTIDASIFIPLIVGAIVLCGILDWSTRNEKDIW